MVEQSEQKGRLAFPPGFLWGVATAAHQFEGNNFNNQWYEWEQVGGIKSGDICGLAADWWEHAERDFDLAQSLGLNALRLSLEWSRIEPSPGKWDGAAIARYRQMLQGLRDRGIEPLVTLHHFTDPIWLAERGGFLDTGALERFERYVAHAVEQLGDLCDFWCTINEPNVYSVLGYQIGDYPPGHKGDIRGAARVLANLARAHAAAYRAIHRLQPNARVGWAQNYNTFDPEHPNNPLDRFVAGVQDRMFNEAFPHAVLTGTAVFPFNLISGSLHDVKGTCDYVGVNTYARNTVRFDPGNPLELFGRRDVAPGAPRGDPGVVGLYGEIYPAGVERVINRVAVFGKPIYVTENGVADAQDRLRPWVIARALKGVHDALSKGIDVRGYFHWSLVDNFEWADGWTMRFGLVELDTATQARTPRPSAALYRAIAQSNALTREMLAQYAPDALDEIFGEGPTP